MTSQATETDRDDLIQLAVEYISKHSEVTSYASETLYAYTEQQQPEKVFLVSDDDMEELGRRLAQDSDAYSRWCADTTAEECTAEAIVAEWRRQGANFDRGVQGLRDDAAAYADYITVAVCDHLASRIRDLIA